jgi:predicted Rossmann fold flavoprotein
MTTEPDLKFDVIILGAGAAGLMCAIEAGKRGRRVAILDSAATPGKKILISGGGRCNFTNIYCKPENFISENPHFAKSALAGYTPREFLALVERHGIAYHEKKLGQLFCNGSAREIVDMLLEEAAAAGVQLFLGVKVIKLEHGVGFRLLTDGRTFRANSVVIATGGLSIPKMGATGIGYEIARKFKIGVIETRPALVPFILSETDQARYCDLTGLAVEVTAATMGHQFEERLLITHRGLSGPAILQISSYWREGETILLNLAPRREIIETLISHGVSRNLASIRTALRDIAPQRLADRILELSPPAAFSNAALRAWERNIHAWSVVPKNTEGYAKAEVTAGGIDTAYLSAKTMESKVPGLFFIGEAVDVTGQLGGFNFQWAWASGAAAGRAV